ncbi:MFS transporter [Ktedonosporobacter rubrisoli]|nr:MFS transporter [Ktedonosporobacter rubrisoli]
MAGPRFARWNKNFLMLWLVNAAGSLSDGMFKLALPIFAASLTTSAVLVAGVSFALSLPWLLFGLPVGALVDRLDRRQIIFWVCLIRVGTLAILALATIMRLISLPLIYICALILGVAETFADSAAISMVPAVVSREKLEQANAKFIGTQTIMYEFLGPTLGGALASLGLALALGSSSGLYLLALLAMFWLKGSFRAERQAQTKLGTDIIEGLSFLWQNKLLRTLTGIVTVMNLGWSAWQAVLVLYAIAPGPLGLTKFEYGLLLTGIGIGGVMGTVVAGPIQRWLGQHLTIGADILGTFVMVGVPALTTNAWLVGIAAVIGGAGATMWSVTVRSLMQRIVPDAFMGRTNGAIRVLGYGSLSLGAALAGIIAQFMGIRAVFWLAALANILLFIPFFLVITRDNIAAAEKSALVLEKVG